MAQRDNRHSEWVPGMHHPAAGPTGRCPVQPSTPLGPDQVNVIFFFIFDYREFPECRLTFTSKKSQFCKTLRRLFEVQEVSPANRKKNPEFPGKQKYHLRRYLNLDRGLETVFPD
jgi:hypothetical protein